jgi:tetratricopeptide (TPR) repeat protein
MVARSGDPLLLDFGIARADDADQLALTRTGDLFGTPAYMPPEQVSGRGARLDGRADVYALGVTMFECLTLRRPFDAPTREGLFQAVLLQEPPDPRRLNPAVTHDVRVVLETALEKDLARRYATAEALANDLAAAREGRPIQARPVGFAGRTIRWAKREPAKAALFAVLIAALPTIATLVTSRVKDLPQLEAARRAARDAEVDAILSAASFELTEGDGARAVARFREALDADAASREAMGGLVLALLKSNEAPAASAAFDRYEAAFESGSARHEIKAMVAESLGRKEEAERLFRESPPPRTAYEHFLRALRDLVKGERGDRDAMRRSLRHADAALHLSNLPRLSIHTLRAHIAAHLGERQVVEDAVVALKHHWPRSADAVYWCGFAQAAFDDPDLLRAGVEDLRKAVAMSPNERRSRTLLGITLGKLGRLDEAAEALREAIRIDPSYVDARYNLSACYRLQGRFAEELATLQEALRALPENDQLLYALGLAHARAQRADEAAAVFRRAVAAAPGSANARYELAVQLEQQGLLDEALSELREAQRLRPDHAETHCNLCGVLQEQHLYAEALVAVRRGHELGRQKKGWRFPSDQWLRDAEVAAAAEIEREASVRKAITDGSPPEEPEVLVAAARVALRLGHAKEAVAWYRTAFEEAPEIADVIELGHRRIAARAAAVAAAAPDLDDAARAALRTQALTWLEEEFARLRTFLRDAGPAPRAVRIGLVPPLRAPEFAPFRDPAALEALPAPERARWSA